MDSHTSSCLIPFNEVIIIEEMISSDTSNTCFLSESRPEVQTPSSLIDIRDSVDISSEPGRKVLQSLYKIPFYPGSKGTVWWDEIRRSREDLIYYDSSNLHRRKLIHEHNKSDFSFHKTFDSVSQEELSNIQFERENLRPLSICVMCKASLMESGEIHVCNQGHLVCGGCFKNCSICVVCKGVLWSSNDATCNFLRRLFHLRSQPIRGSLTEGMFTTDKGEHDVKYFCYRTIKCPEPNCRVNLAFNYFLPHFVYDHKTAPIVELLLYEIHPLVLPKSSLEMSIQSVVAVFSLIIPYGREKMGLFQDYIPSCLLAAPFSIQGNKAYVFWVSCFFEEKRMPPVGYSLRASTTKGRKFFCGGITSLHSCRDANIVVDKGQGLILMSKDVETENIDYDNNSIVLEVQFNSK